MTVPARGPGACVDPGRQREGEGAAGYESRPGRERRRAVTRRGAPGQTAVVRRCRRSCPAMRSTEAATSSCEVSTVTSAATGCS